jgi:WD40 repeat protein
MQELIPITTPLQEFKGHEDGLSSVTVFPNKRRMITGSGDKTLRLWDLETGVVLKKMGGHRNGVHRLTVSPDGQFIASGDSGGMVIIWHEEIGEWLSQPIEAHSDCVTSLDFSPDGTMLATCSYNVTKLWNTKTWQQQGEQINLSGDGVGCVRYSPSGELLATATNIIEIYNSSTRELVTSFKGHTSHNFGLAWTPDGLRLLTGGNELDPTIREWNTTTWQQVGDPWTGHSDYINVIVVHPAGTLVASLCHKRHVRLWRLSDRRTVAIFKHSLPPEWVTFSADGKKILSGGNDKMISEWAIPDDINSKVRFRP